MRINNLGDERGARYQPAPVSTPRLSLPDLDTKTIEAEAREAQARVRTIRLGRDAWEQILDSRAKCNRALREPDLHVFAKLFEDCLKRSLEAQAFSGREIGGDDDVLDFLVGHFVDVDLTRQPAS
jgi:hypothetical protein